MYRQLYEGPQSENFQMKNPTDLNLLPYSCSVITQKISQYAAKYLNECEEKKIRGLRALQEILNEDPEREDNRRDLYLLSYLRSRKFDCKRTSQMFQRALEFTSKNKRLFVREFEVARHLITSNCIGFLPYRDLDGRAIAYLRVESLDVDTMPAEDIIFGTIVLLQSSYDNPVNQILGYTVIIDVKHFTFKQIACFLPWMFCGAQAFQHACPGRIQALHFISIPKAFEVVFERVKGFLGEKLSKRIFLHRRSNLDTLYKYIPTYLLPEELGGELGPFSNERWVAHIDEIEESYLEKMRYMHVIKDNITKETMDDS